MFRDDDEAARLWQKVAGVPADRVFRGDEKDNFWQMGDTGPCGPCSEIHYDLGTEASEPGHEHETFPSDCGGRYVEIWNLVFMQFDRATNGEMTPLPRPSIDTGMGLERLAAVMQGKLSNFDTDLLLPVVQRAEDLIGTTYGDEIRSDIALRINADHARAAAFLIQDGVVPSNDGRGYVLRKIMRRALRHGRRFGMHDPYLYQLAAFVAEHMRPAYPELMESVQRVSRIVKDEEHRYATTFQVAERVFHDEARSAAHGVMPGQLAFKLYDTYGLALDEQQEMAREYGLAIDLAGFGLEMEAQRERARASWRGAQQARVAPVYQDLLDRGRTEFLGYETLETRASRVAGIVVGENSVDQVGPGTEAEIFLDRTPFYAEAGGQVGDTGVLLAPDNALKLADVHTVYYALPGLSAHKVAVLAPIHAGDIVVGRVAEPPRRSTMRNHTATHLLQAALRQVLGSHVKQAGSVVEPTRLRFDFTHYAALDSAEMEEVERLVNQQILYNAAVGTSVMDLEHAIAGGAMALFGEKYGDRVRVVSIPGFSQELCGGTHVARTGDIGLFKVVYEGSISAGVRRIEAITGEGALRRFKEASDSLARLSNLVRTSEPELIEQVERLLAQQRALEKQVEQMKLRLAQAQAAELEAQARVLKGVKVLAGRVDGLDRQQMRALADSLRNKWKSAVLVLASASDGNVALLSAVTKDLTAKVHAGRLVGTVAAAIGGKGGGRPDMAEAGGKDPAALPAALEQVYSAVEALL